MINQEEDEQEEEECEGDVNDPLTDGLVIPLDHFDDYCEDEEDEH